MLIERQKKKLTAIRRMRKIANRPAKHRALQHSAHASLRAFFPLDLFVDRSVYLPRRPAVSLGFETGQRCPNSRRNDWNQIYLKERREKRNAEDETKQESKTWRDQQRESLLYCPFFFFFLKVEPERAKKAKFGRKAKISYSHIYLWVVLGGYSWVL